jgi:hypothetical protein
LTGFFERIRIQRRTISRRVEGQQAIPLLTMNSVGGNCNMLSGIYSVAFESNRQAFGTGVAVFTDDGRVGGGDDTYLYQGFLSVNGDTASGKVRVAHYQGQRNSIFPGVDQYNLELAGNISGPNITLSGVMVEHPEMKVALTCKKLADL